MTTTVQQGKQNNDIPEKKAGIHVQHYAEWEREERLSAN